MPVVDRRVVLPAPAAQVWARATTPEGVTFELAPWLSMTVPPGLRGKTLADADGVVGRPLGKAWVLLGGALPVEFDDMTIVEIGDLCFHERSRMLTLGRWEHQRAVRPLTDDACELRDVLTFSVRPGLAAVPGVDGITTRIVDALFAHRHRRLAAAYPRG
ncbi:hypothetical protein FE697_001550 [Mumia zhuanghuii]|uniref:Polyketide cyclase / dehydrase and lipid transport n=2 Tax=Mumia TaxID=1546255 RepID=A0ABW1QG50_9ACTN|nr:MULTISPECIES: hypothetical protein [Mumia]KAA1424638.1 hypothetical protein FE697_001550 [Mumia zhuanghuii]